MIEVNQRKGVEKAMTKPRKKQGNPDFRHRVSVPTPATQEIESRLFELVSPGTFANLKGVKDKERSLRSRVLTLPVMAVIWQCEEIFRQQHPWLLTPRIL
ncbi:hypothetical protein [Nostoc sp. DedQUE09]|uniref:hypothetical protein n=1 Tax=Nostoc sp. DedQUE09 TaxID=3075394 RepID=UPI002AD44CD2|nr:hypothetical protein [Nostoc sp. DedQUE09]MDZ7954826.1 hypothetical protein [Nostoc sp. DedQUE09]